MFWVVQDDMFQENRRDDLIETLCRFDIPYQLVKINSDYNIYPDVEYEGNIITNGSILLSKIAVKNGWKPGSLFNDNFTYEVWYPHFKDWLLNRDAVFTTLADANPVLDKLFVRPLLDDKQFTGRVMTRDEFYKWRAVTNIPQDIQILYSSVKQIGQEHRHFIVDGEVISSSRYKLNGQANYTNYVDSYIVKFAQAMVDIWQPSKGFVLDTYISAEGIGIVEMGCICHAGLYQTDVQKIVMALDGMKI